MNPSLPPPTQAPVRLLSVVIPARDEEGCIASTVEHLHLELKMRNIPHEIVVVDDGSKDRTWAIITDLCRKIAELNPVQNSGPHGFGRAINFGMEQSKGDAVVIMMADESDDCRDVVRYWHELQRGYDCVFGSRFMKGGGTIDYPVIKYIINRIANHFLKLLFNIQLNDTTNAFKAYRRKVIDGCRPLIAHHFNLTVELPLKAIIRGYSWTAIPITWRNRRTGIAKLKIAEMGSRYLFICLYIWLEKYLTAGDYKRPDTQPKTPTITTFKAFFPSVFCLILPLWLAVHFVHVYGTNTPVADDWLIGLDLTAINQRTLQLSTLLTPHNEHCIALPRALCLALSLDGTWDLCRQMFLGLIFISITFLLISGTYLKALKKASLRDLLLCTACAFALFSLNQPQNLLWGFQIAWFMQCCLLALSLTFLNFTSLPSLFVTIIATLSTLVTMGNSSAVIISVIVYTLLQPTAPDERVRKRGFLIFLTCALTISLLYAFFSHRNTPHHLASLNQTLAFLFSVIGHPLFAPWVHPYNTSLPKISLCIFGGALICVIFTVLTLYSLRSQSLRNAKVINYCIALGIFSITSAILIASGRTALGLALSLETRYITFTTPLYLGIIFALGYIASQHNNRLLNIFAISFSIVILANAIAIIPAAQRYGADLRFIHSYLRDCLSLAQHLPPNFHPEQRLFQSAPPPTTMETYKHLAETHYMTITHNELNQALSTNLSSATCSSYNTISTTNGTVISGTITDPTTIHAPSLICAIQRDSNNIPKIIAINAPSRPLPEKFLSSRLGQPSNPAKWSLYLPSSISSELDIYAFDDRSQKLIFLFHWMPLTP